MVFRKYLNMLEEEYNSAVKKVAFKNKSTGWNTFSTLIEFENGKQYIKDRYHDLYMLGYLKYNLYLRPSCHQCQYKELPRVSDITLGDFWGIKKSRPHLDEDKGTSLVMINSNKGKNLFKKILHKIIWEECTLEEVIRGNPCLLKSVPVGEYREEFFREIVTNSFRKAFFTVTKHDIQT